MFQTIMSPRTLLLSSMICLWLLACQPPEKAVTVQAEVGPDIQGIAVKATRSGLLEQVLVEPGQSVAINDPLFVIRPVIELDPIGAMNPELTPDNDGLDRTASDQQKTLFGLHQAIERYNQIMIDHTNSLSDNDRQRNQLYEQRRHCLEQRVQDEAHPQEKPIPTYPVSDRSGLPDDDHLQMQCIAQYDLEIDKLDRLDDLLIAEMILHKTVLLNKLNEWSELNQIKQTARSDRHRPPSLDALDPALAEELRFLEDNLAQKSQISFILATQSGCVSSVLTQCEGLFITKDEQLCIIQPDNMPLSLSLKIPAQYKDKVQPGMKVRYRFDAFPEDRDLFGTIKRRLDLTVQEDPNQPYILYSSTLERSYTLKKGKRIPFLPGMKATAEVMLSYR
ncbi:HlyD family efflux transporter periplasmic adaptor subunit [bacterium]|nr:HlyD family efflux transporter periplasmic adaptor subunit [bacterium]